MGMIESIKQLTTVTKTERHEKDQHEKTAVNQRALRAAQRTLNGIDFEKFWERVIEKVAPFVAANEQMRAKSLEKGWRVLR